MALNPTMDKLADDYDGKVKITKVNVDENQEIPERYGIRGIPTLILFKDGELVDQVVGGAPQQIEMMLKQHSN